MGKLKDKVADHYDKAYNTGYLQGVVESGWRCGDCGNLYDSSVIDCPNVILDEAILSGRLSSDS